jgi:putative SOS response-associated peptidase YedK
MFAVVMCGRFLFTSPPEAVGRAFSLAVTENFPPRWNVAPTQPIALVRLGPERTRVFALARWGFIPSWAKKDWHERMGGKPLINARSETVAEKPTFRHAWKRRRCLIPADGFYEWRSEAGGRQPYRLMPTGEGPIGFAGLWETAIDPDGGEIDTAAILTTMAGPDVAALHDREPIVIPPADYASWLDADERDVDGLVRLLGPARRGFWRIEKASKAINNPRSEGESLAAAAS